MNIYGKKVVLRAIELSDCALIQDMFNDPEMENLVVGWRISGSLSKRRRMAQWGLPH